MFEHAVLVDAGLVGEGVFADDRLVALDVQACERADEAADGDELFGVDARGEGEGVLAGLDSHDDFFQRGVAGAFADAVDGAFNLARAAADGGEGVGDGEAQVVVTVGGKNNFVGAGDVLEEVTEHGFMLGGGSEADGVGTVNRRGSRFDRGVHDFAEIIQFGPGGIFGREFDVAGVFAREGDVFARHADEFFLGFFQFELAVDF